MLQKITETGRLRLGIMDRWWVTWWLKLASWSISAMNFLQHILEVTKPHIQGCCTVIGKLSTKCQSVEAMGKVSVATFGTEGGGIR